MWKHQCFPAKHTNHFISQKRVTIWRIYYFLKLFSIPNMAYTSVQNTLHNEAEGWGAQVCLPQVQLDPVHGVNQNVLNSE